MIKGNKKINKVLLYVLVGVFGVVSMFSSVITSGLDKISDNWADTVFNAFVLEHTYKAFFDSGYTADLLTPRFFHPYENTFLLSDNLFGSAPVYWFYRAFFEWATAFQLWGITVLILTYICTLILFEDLDISPPVGALSAYVFVFGLPRVGQIWHPQLFPQFYTPLALMFLFRLLKNPSLKYLNLFVLFVYMQLLAGYYLGWFLVFGLFVAFFVWGGFYPDGLRKVITFILNNKKRVGLSMLLWAVLFGITWVPYFVIGAKFKDIGILNFMVSGLGGPETWLLAPKNSLWGNIFRFFFECRANINELQVFAGFYFVIILVLSFLFLMAPVLLHNGTLKKYFIINFGGVSDDEFSASLIKTLFFTGAVISLLILNIFDFSTWAIIYVFIPGSEGIRYVPRIWVIIYLMFLISGSLIASSLLKKIKYSASITVLLVFLYLFFLGEQVVWNKPYYSLNDFNKLTDKLKVVFLSNKGCDAYYKKVVIPDGLSKTESDAIFIRDNLPTMWAGMETNKPVLNGYTSFMLYNFINNYNEENIKKAVNRPGETICVLDEQSDGSYRLSRITM